MERVNIYLRTPLFAYGNPDHIPDGVMIIEGHLIDREASCVRINAELLRDERGRTLLDEGVTLIVPWAKIDHILVFE